MTQILNCIGKLVDYGVQTGLVAEEDRFYITNRLLELFRLDGMDDLPNLDDEE